MRTRREEWQEQILERTQAAGEFVTDVDGYVYFWPSREGSGHYSATHLRILADELDRRNLAWDTSIQNDPVFKETK